VGTAGETDFLGELILLAEEKYIGLTLTLAILWNLL
jgi:hypothetical protein